MMKMTWAVRVSSVAAPSHGASGAQGRQHEMLRLQEEGYFLSSPCLGIRMGGQVLFFSCGNRGGQGCSAVFPAFSTQLCQRSAARGAGAGSTTEAVLSHDNRPMRKGMRIEFMNHPRQPLG